MTAATDLHNKLAGEIVKSIVRPILEAGGARTDILVLTESVVTGIVEFCARNDGVSRGMVYDALMDGVDKRLTELREREERSGT